MFNFIKNVAQDERIPERDKKIVLACLALIVSPIDIIPDWIPIIGVIDDIILLAIVLDYFFDVLDQEILLTHYPYGMKSFTMIRRLARTITWMTPRWIKNTVWKYEKSPYR
ncbi:MAG: DUF1232 domain-containing protein [Bdellovibrionales bacterium]|nr:DUF1232 domain-containing protein [Bdellovibrionales bacterium]